MMTIRTRSVYARLFVILALIMAEGSLLFTSKVGVQTVRAASFTVSKFTDTNDGTCDADCSLREAIRAANVDADVDDIILGAGTYVLSISGSDNVSAVGDLDITKPVTITGQGAGVTIIQQTIADRVIDVRHTTGVVALQNLTIIGGNVSAGAGISAYQGELHLDNVSVEQNTATNGAGMYVSSGKVTITGGRFYSNTASDQGAGIFVSQDTARVWQSGDTVFSYNVADGYGGALYLEDGQAELQDFQLIYNSGYHGAAAMVYGDESRLTLSKGLIAYNHATEDGGGISAWDGQVILSQVAVVHNQADNIGGGLVNEYGSMSLTNVTVSDNTALVKTSVGGGGGGLYLSGSSIYASKTTMIHSTVANNTSSKDDSGILLTSGQLTVQNSIIANNSGDNCVFGSRGEVISQGGNFEETDTCHLSDPTDHPVTDPKLAALTAQNYHPLMGSSPAIDAVLCLAEVTVDQRGATRPSGAGCDSGAFEAMPTPVTAVSISGPTTGLFAQPLVFTANPEPADASGPLVYTWSPAPSTGQGTDTATYRWFVLGPHVITVSVTNAGGQADSDPFTVTIGGLFNYVPMIHR